MNHSNTTPFGDESIQNEKDKMSQFDQSHQESMQFVKSALIKAEIEIEMAKSIELEQKKISQSMRAVKNELGENGKRLDSLQIDISNIHEEIEEGRVRLAVISSETSQIKDKNNLIDQECTHIRDQCGIIHDQQEQIEMGYQEKKKIQKHRSTKELIFDDAKNRIRSVRIFTLGKIDGLKKYSISIATSLGKNMSYAKEKIDSAMVSIALNAMKYSVGIVLDFAVKVTVSMISNSNPINLVVIGIFTSCFAYIAIANYPLTSILVGGILLIIVKDATISYFNIWKNAKNTPCQEA